MNRPYMTFNERYRTLCARCRAACRELMERRGMLVVATRDASGAAVGDTLWRTDPLWDDGSHDLPIAALRVDPQRRVLQYTTDAHWRERGGWRDDWDAGDCRDILAVYYWLAAMGDMQERGDGHRGAGAWMPR